MGRKATQKWIRRAVRAVRGSVTDQLKARRLFGKHRRFQRLLR